jgi:hypothetical protein
MSGQCKICNCSQEQRENIENRIKCGEQALDIARDLAAFGITISHTSILRHKRNHMLDFQNEKSTPLKYSIVEDMKARHDPIDVKNIIDNIVVEILNRDYRKNATENVLIAQSLMAQICQKQLVIVDTQLQRYCEGTAGYPNDHIRGLKIVLDIMKDLPSYENKEISRQIAQVNVKANLNVFESQGFDDMAEYSKGYKSRNLFRPNNVSNPVEKPFKYTFDMDSITGNRTIEAIAYDNGRDRWAKLNQKHILANDHEISNYIESHYRNMVPSEELDKRYISHLEIICNQIAPTLKWVKSLNLFKEFEDGKYN